MWKNIAEKKKDNHIVYIYITILLIFILQPFAGKQTKEYYYWDSVYYKIYFFSINVSSF